MRAEERGGGKGSRGFIPAGLVRNVGEESDTEEGEAKVLTQRSLPKVGRSKRAPPVPNIKAPQYGKILRGGRQKLQWET